MRELLELHKAVETKNYFLFKDLVNIIIVTLEQNKHKGKFRYISNTQRENISNKIHAIKVWIKNSIYPIRKKKWLNQSSVYLQNVHVY